MSRLHGSSRRGGERSQGKGYGTEGSLEWLQEEPNYLYHRPAEAPERVLKRDNDYLCEEARAATRVPPGHPEAFIEAFANLYAGVTEAVRAKEEGRESSSLPFPTVYDGARGVNFMEKVVESAGSEKKWTEASYPAAIRSGGFASR